MKLTNTLRDAFVASAMNDVPQIDYDPIIRKAVTVAVVGALPDAIRKAYGEKDSAGYFETATRGCGGIRVSVPGFYDHKTGAMLPKLSVATERELEALGKKNTDQKAERDALSRKLRGAAYAASTRKVLVEMLPEFEKYLPPDDAAANRSLPVVANIVADFVKAGWPKGKKPAKPVA